MITQLHGNPDALVPGEATCNGHTVFICRAAGPGYLVGDERTGVMTHYPTLDDWRASHA